MASRGYRAPISDRPIFDGTRTRASASASEDVRPLKDSLLSTDRLLRARTRPVVGRFAHQLLRYLSGAEVPSEVAIGRDVVIHHQAFGLVVHPNTRIGDRVHLFHGVTLGVGRDRLWEPNPDREYGPIVVEDDVWLCTRATVVAGEGELRIGRGTIVGAGAVLLESTGAWEVWAGVPARCVGTRRPSIWLPPHSRPASGDGVIWLSEDSPVTR